MKRVERRQPARANFWFWAALLLNVFYIGVGLYVASYSFGMSFFFVLTGLFSLAVILWARFSREFVLYPLHVGAVILLLLGAYASYTDLLSELLWFDFVLHFFGGLFVALYVLAVTHHQVYDWWALVLWAVAITTLVGVFWEFAEFGSHVLLQNPSFNASLTDVLSDLFADILGASIAALPFAWLLRPPRRLGP